MGLRKKIEDWMVAVTFAEAGAYETAREVLEGEKYAEKKERVPATERVALERKELRAPSIQR